MSTSIAQLEHAARQRTAQRADLNAAVCEYVLSHPGCTHGEVAAATGVAVQKLARVCGPVLARVLRHDENDWASETSDAALICAVQSVATRVGRVPSSALYSTSRTEQEPSASKLTTRFGSWSHVIEVAGLGSAPASTKASTEQIFEFVRRFVATGQSSQNAYSVWAKDNDAPSLSWVLVKMGSWSSLTARAQGVA